MKVTFEIDRGEFKYSFECGSSKGEGSGPHGYQEVQVILECLEWIRLRHPDKDIQRAKRILKTTKEFQKKIAMDLGETELAAKWLEALRKEDL